MGTDGINNQESPVSWKFFGSFLGGHAVQFEKDSDVAISDGFAFLPISKAFLMTFALVGRFCGEPDRRRKVRGEGLRM
jgi:hypothetical protein